MNQGAVAVKKNETGGKPNETGTKHSNVFAIQKAVEAVGKEKLVAVPPFANRKESGQDTSGQTAGEKRESGNGGGAKKESGANQQFSANPFASGAYFYEEARVMY